MYIYVYKYSLLCASMGCICTVSTNQGLNIFRKWNYFCALQYTGIFLVLISWTVWYNNYFCSVFIGFGTISNLEITWSMIRLYKNNIPFHLKDLTICGLWYLKTFLEQILYGCQETASILVEIMKWASIHSLVRLLMFQPLYQCFVTHKLIEWWNNSEYYILFLPSFWKLSNWGIERLSNLFNK